MNGPSSFKLCMWGKIRLEDDGNITHLQKYSPLGYLITWPFGFHFWFFWRKQLQRTYDDHGVTKTEWVAGTEQGIYFRTPGYRYDKDYGMIWTWGYIGSRWD